jgi:multisubunit Na+/H+ antiporter MnhG subunit
VRGLLVLMLVMFVGLLMRLNLVFIKLVMIGLLINLTPPFLARMLEKDCNHFV